ncbi:MAG: NAD(P)H-dependent oxidoreductase subunit E [Candidatus Dormibacteraeota bacterium]|nr:NAD(P)H-dependent oxidoreductase subunit E [Candidatus Dormibacteraeota bacterium]
MPARYPQARSAVMPALDLAQEEVGWLPRSVMEEVAGLLQLDPGYIEGVATFYTLFHLQPQGRHHFYVCTNLSCALRGAYDRVKHLREVTGATDREKPSPDGDFQVTEVECLGACEYAPMLRYDEAYHYDLTDEKLDQLVAAARAEREEPARPKRSGTPPRKRGK